MNNITSKLFLTCAVYLTFTSNVGANNYGNKYNVSFSELPVWGIGDPRAPHQIKFIWSPDCTECQSKFQKEIDPIIGRSYRMENMTQIILIESGNTDEILNVTCRGRDFYTGTVLRFLDSNNIMQNIISSQSRLTPDSTACRDINESRKSVSFFEEELSKRITIQKLPIIIFDNKVVQDLREIRLDK